MAAVDALLAAYPTVKHAIAWVELFVVMKNDDEPESAWDWMMSRPQPLTPADIATAIRDSVDEGDEDVGRAALAKAEMGRPEFLTYIAGRMGAC
jgi:hypothetical protein